MATPATDSKLDKRAGAVLGAGGSRAAQTAGRGGGGDEVSVNNRHEPFIAHPVEVVGPGDYVPFMNVEGRQARAAAKPVGVTVDDVRALASTLPRTSEHVIRDRVKFRVGAIVYVAFSRDEKEMGFGYPKEERKALISTRPDIFFWPRPSDLRFHWVECRLERLDPDEMQELIIDAWTMVAPKKVSAAYRDTIRARDVDSCEPADVDAIRPETGSCRPTGAGDEYFFNPGADPWRNGTADRRSA